MSKYLNGELIERILFTTIVLGLLMAIFGGLRFLDLSNQIANNEAAQIQNSGEEIAPQTNAEARGLVASDMERRRLVSDRFNMMVVGGIGLALIGVGWMAMDITRNRRRKNEAQETSSNSIAEAAS